MPLSRQDYVEYPGLKKLPPSVLEKFNRYNSVEEAVEFLPIKFAYGYSEVSSDIVIKASKVEDHASPCHKIVFIFRRLTRTSHFI